MRHAKINALSYAILIRELVESPSSYKELAEVTGLAYCTVREAVHAWHVHKIVYIAGYNKDARGRDNERIWRFGLDKKDAKRFAFTKAERQARTRAKRKAQLFTNILGATCVNQANEVSNSSGA